MKACKDRKVRRWLDNPEILLTMTPNGPSAKILENNARVLAHDYAPFIRTFNVSLDRFVIQSRLFPSGVTEELLANIREAEDEGRVVGHFRPRYPPAKEHEYDVSFMFEEPKPGFYINWFSDRDYFLKEFPNSFVYNMSYMFKSEVTGGVNSKFKDLMKEISCKFYKEENEIAF